MNVHHINRISDCPASDWNRITGTDYPFLRHEFLHALEASGSVDSNSGWQPNHILLFDRDKLVALMPLYIKTHSYGEYVFDWSWADAYQRNSIPYYPKLVSAIPFTPATGPRIAVKGVGLDQATAWFCQAIAEQLEQKKFSSWHHLFPVEAEKTQLKSAGLLERKGVQYHWLNRNITEESYRDFDDFLATFKSRQRKNLRKERQQVFAQGITIEVLTGDQLTAEVWQQFYRFYQITYAKRSGHGGYLTREFFQQIGQTMADQIVLVMAYQDGEPIAAALNFKSSDTLYGRYWGTSKRIDGLHFEACYYQGIEYCIANGLKKFDPGAQGEHKIQRGFEPVFTDSMHLIAHPGFRDAIEDFLNRESAHLEHYMEDAKQLLPFKTLDGHTSRR